MLVWRNTHLSILLLISIFSFSQSRPFSRIKSVQSYHSEWASLSPPPLIHNASRFLQPNEICESKVCPFFYYEYSNPQNDSLLNRTVLMVSGMHGNEFIGPHVLLYGYKHFQAARIVYFPLANPSGFEKDKRQTIPGELDPNRDYPIDKNTECYRTTATHILDYIFRAYNFDLTVILHNGASQISFPWGTYTHLANSHTEDYAVMRAAAEMMQGEAGHTKLQEFSVGTMDQVIYAARGTFDDWAYAASKSGMTNACKGKQYQPYPTGMTNGLVFLIELGPFKISQLGSEQSLKEGTQIDGYVTRGIRIIKRLMTILNPQIKVTRNGAGKLAVTTKGCRSAILKQFIVEVKSAEEWQVAINSTVDIHIEGDMRRQPPKQTIFTLPVKMAQLSTSEQDLSYYGSFVCDPAFQSQGTTFFSLSRTYKFSHITKLSSLPHGQIHYDPLSELAKHITGTQLSHRTVLILQLTLYLITLAVALFICAWLRHRFFRPTVKFEVAQQAVEIKQVRQQEAITEQELNSVERIT